MSGLAARVLAECWLAGRLTPAHRICRRRGCSGSRVVGVGAEVWLPASIGLVGAVIGAASALLGQWWSHHLQSRAAAARRVATDGQRQRTGANRHDQVRCC